MNVYGYCSSGNDLPTRPGDHAAYESRNVKIVTKAEIQRKPQVRAKIAAAKRRWATNRLASITYPSGNIIAVQYDTNGQISALSQGATALISNVAYLPRSSLGDDSGAGGKRPRTYSAARFAATI